MDWVAVRLTLALASLTTLALAAIGLPLACWLAATRWRGRFLVEATVALPLVLPPTVLGFYFLMATGPATPIGRAYGAATDSTLPFTFPGILLAAVLCNLPFAVRPFTAAIEAVPRRLVEASWCSGESRARTFWRVTLPLAWPGVLAGMILSFAHTVGEFGVVLMVGGAVPGVTKTLSVAIYDDVQALDYASAGRTSAALLAFALVALCLVQRLGRRESVE
ncbi:MAG TPA: molybdate ABC transporter permease subunit [Planctomycetia bacterium]|nr:molybdate ABC transporter permease subunit [Planctomycetia bacterium]